MARRIGQPLQSLADAARRLGRGDFSTSVPTSGTAEVAALARTMDDMRRNLIDLTVTLRRREAEAQARDEPALPRWSLRPSGRDAANPDPHITFTADLHKSLRGRTSPELWNLATGLYAGSTQLPAPKALSPVTDCARDTITGGIAACGEEPAGETLEGLLAGWLEEGKKDE